LPGSGAALLARPHGAGRGPAGLARRRRARRGAGGARAGPHGRGGVPPGGTARGGLRRPHLRRPRHPRRGRERDRVADRRLIRMESLQPISGPWALLAMTLKVTGVFTIVMVVVAYATLAERRVSAFIQDRRGPNRVGPFGLLQPIADGIKNILKEETLPATA